MSLFFIPDDQFILPSHFAFFIFMQGIKAVIALSILIFSITDPMQWSALILMPCSGAGVV
jgi:hypothetical protein